MSPTKIIGQGVVAIILTVQRVLAAALICLLGISASFADEDDNFQVVAGLGVYLGVMPAGIVRGHPASHPEATMHGGAPRNPHDYHIVIAVFDEPTGARMENAQVTMRISGLGHVGIRTLRLEPMAIAGTVTYGNFIELPGNDRYELRFDIKVPGRSASVAVEFSYQHRP